MSLNPKKPVRIVFCTRASVYSDLVLQILSHSDDVEICGIIDSTRIFKANEKRLVAKVRFTSKVGLRYALYSLAITTPHPRHPKIPKWEDAKTWANQLGCPFHQSSDINDEVAREFMSRCNPDITLSAHFNQIFHARTLQDKSWNYWNIHPGALPTMRGVDPGFFALLRGNETATTTLHEITPGIDEGPLLATETVPITEASLLKLNLTLFELAAKATVKLLASNDKIESQPQSPAKEHYDSWPVSRDVAQLIQKGINLL